MKIVQEASENTFAGRSGLSSDLWFTIGSGRF